MDEAAEEEITELRKRLVRMEWVVTGMTLCGLTFFAVFTLIVVSSIPKFEVIFEEMLAGRPLPLLTGKVAVLSQYRILGALAFMIPFGAAVFLILRRDRLWHWGVVLLAIIFLIFLGAVVSLALWLPFIDVLWGLQEAP